MSPKSMNYLNEAPVCVQCKIVSSSWWRWRDGMRHHYSIKHSTGWPTAPVTQKRSRQPCTGLLHHSMFAGTFDGVMEHFQHTYDTVMCEKHSGSASTPESHYCIPFKTHEDLFIYFKAQIILETACAVIFYFLCCESIYCEHQCRD